MILCEYLLPLLFVAFELAACAKSSRGGHLKGSKIVMGVAPQHLHAVLMQTSVSYLDIRSRLAKILAVDRTGGVCGEPGLRVDGVWSACARAFGPRLRALNN